MTKPTRVRGSGGIIATGHRLATEVGLDVLKSGGNAFDAAVAAAATLAIVAPHECGLGGDLIAVVQDGRTGSVRVLNGSGQSPAAATLERYPDGVPELGPLSISVPGMVGAWGALHAQYGSRPLADLLGPAIAFAEDGFVVSPVMAQNIVERRASIAANAACADLFLPNGMPLAVDARLRQPAAARTLRGLATDGCAAFYDAAHANLMAADIEAAGGLLTAEDFTTYRSLWQDAVSVHFHGSVVHTTPPNTWGIATLIQLAKLEQQGAATDEADFFIQGMRIREKAYRLLRGTIGDPDVVDDCARSVLDAVVAGDRQSLDGQCARPNGSDTSQVICADEAGNVVSLLQSISVPFGSGILLPRSGVLLNNRLSGFEKGLEGANVVAPRRRPANTLVPALVTRDGAPFMACATPGGPGQTGTLAQVLGRIMARGETIESAIAAPRWSVTRYGDCILEDTAPKAIAEAVREVYQGLKTAPWGAVNAGSVALIQRDGDGWIGATDARRDAGVGVVRRED